MPRECTPFEQFCEAESQLLQLLGTDADERLFNLSTWESADEELLGLFPAISSALSVISEEPKIRHESATSSEPLRSSPCSSTGSAASSASSASSRAPSSSASSRSSAASACSSGTPTGQRPAAAAAARWCQPGFKDLQLLASREDVASIPRASSIEEVLALLSKEDVIVVPTHGGVILYEVTYLDDLVSQQPPTVIPPSPDDPATQLSPEVFNLFLQNEEMLSRCQESAGLHGLFADTRRGLFC